MVGRRSARHTDPTDVEANEGVDMDLRPSVAGVFDRAAQTYDRVGVELFQPIADRLVQELAPRPGERVLDLGCGRGAVLLPLARAVEPSGAVIGIDLSPRMVELAREESATAGVSSDVRVGDAQEPDFPAASFDVVASSLVVFFLPDPPLALQRWHGLLVPGGRMGVSTFGPFSPHWKPVDDVFQPYLPEQLRDARTSGTAGPFASDAGVEGLLSAAGFTDVRTVTMDLPVRFADEEHWYRWSWSIGQRAMWEAVPEGERASVRAQAFERLQDCRDETGRIGFDQVVRFTLGTAASSPRV